MRLVLTVAAPAAVHAAHPMVVPALRTPGAVLGIANPIMTLLVLFVLIPTNACTMLQFTIMVCLVLIAMIQAAGGIAALELGWVAAAEQMVAQALVLGVVLIQITLVPWVLVVQAVWIVIALS